MSISDELEMVSVVRIICYVSRGTVYETYNNTYYHATVHSHLHNSLYLSENWLTDSGNIHKLESYL